MRRRRATVALSGHPATPPADTAKRRNSARRPGPSDSGWGACGGGDDQQRVPPIQAQAQRWQLVDERRRVFQAAQVQQQTVFGDAADHRQRQAGAAAVASSSSARPDALLRGHRRDGQARRWPDARPAASPSRSGPAAPPRRPRSAAPPRALTAGCTRQRQFADRRWSSGRVSRRSVGRSCINRSGRRYRRSVASSAASGSLLMRSARFSGYLRMRPMASLLPTRSGRPAGHPSACRR